MIGQFVKVCFLSFKEENDMTKRRRFTDDFKAKIALEALRGDQTLSQIAARHKLHPNQISQWKLQALEGLSSVFASGKRGTQPSDMDAKIKDLHAKIGELTVERDFLSRGLGR